MAFDTPAPSDLMLAPVRSAAELRRFIDLPNRLNAEDPNWVVPLMYERMAALTPKTNPFFDHAEVQLWLAVRDGRDVGRISAQIDRLATESGAGKTGNFGMIAGEDDPEVFGLLLRTAEAWLRERGCTQALGPFNLSINEEVGLLVDGFDSKPMVMMGHDPRYAGARVEEQGYVKAKDVYAYVCDPRAALPPVVVRRIKRGLPAGVTMRQLDMKRYDEEVKALTSILNDAWSENWGFVPTTEAETAQLGKALKDVIDPRLVLFAEIDGEVAAFIVLLPNVNEAIEGLKGKLLPFGWARLLWRLKVKRVKSIRIPLMGLKKKFADSLRGQVLPFHLMNAGRDAGIALGYDKFEFSWILEDNMPMRRISEAMGARIYKTYRLYEKTL
ncbi:dATP pyrophosphohydrolase [Caulobacter endophyticus]|uniref:dATP pyrophosphohydrolase n=1 Tax=Caulobacter endophyticus TaxID=2172652 RepID=UPI00240F6D19|nr:dATP pyrophosphohydrolase [Caulobacter endophyticus]MDG2531560.1 dATP pyrophosphohydrolase [Caulobacter endophyticus]